MPVQFDAIDDLLRAAAAEGRRSLFEHEVYRLIHHSGAVRVPRTLFVPKGEPVCADGLEQFVGSRVVVKIVGGGISHKSDLGGVAFVDRNVASVTKTMDEMLRIDFGSAADVRGVVVCEYFDHGGAGFGHELFVGFRRTREFGPVLAAGLGGRHTEYFAAHLRQGLAVAMALPFETTGREFFELFRRTVAYDLAAGKARGYHRVVPDDGLVECFEAFVAMARRYSAPEDGEVPSIVELEVNPFAFRDGFMVPLDGLCHLADPAPAPPTRPVRKVDRLLHPKSIAVVGASSKGMNPGRVILRNLGECGFDRQQIFAVKEGIDQLDGFKCVADYQDLPRPVDLLVVAVSAAQVPELVDQVVTHRAAEAVILIPGGMGETEGGKETEQRVRHQIAQAHATPDGGPVFVGGNCLGIQSRPGRYDTFFIPSSKLPKRWDSPGRRIALVSQSGAYIITRMSNLETLDPRYAISMGNQTDLTVSDLLTALADTGEVDVFGVYVEGFQDWDGLAFARVAAELTAAGKDVVFYKAGRTAAGRSATAGHTASIAGDYNVAVAAAANAGAFVCESFKEFEDMLLVASHLNGRRIGGTRIGAISNAGYESVGMADALVGPRHEVSLSALDDACLGRIREVLAANRIEELVNAHNPLDLTPMATDEVHEECARAMLACPQVDAVISAFVPLTPAMKTTPDEVDHPSSMVRRLPKLHAETDKPLVAVIDSGPLYDPLARGIREAGLCVFRSADSAMRSLGRYLYDHTRRAGT